MTLLAVMTTHPHDQQGYLMASGQGEQSHVCIEMKHLPGTDATSSKLTIVGDPPKNLSQQ